MTPNAVEREGGMKRSTMPIPVQEPPHVQYHRIIAARAPPP